MAHLHMLGLENFRLFKKMQHFDFSPITILTGVNNSGKSSVIKALLLLKESFGKSEEISELLFTDNSQNLGTFSNCTNRFNKNKFLRFKIRIPSGHFENCILELEYTPNVKFPENGILRSFKVIHNESELLSFEHSSVINEIEGFGHSGYYNGLDCETKLKIDISRVEELFKPIYLQLVTKQDGEKLSESSKRKEVDKSSFLYNPNLHGFSLNEITDNPEPESNIIHNIHLNNSSFNTFFKKTLKENNTYIESANLAVSLFEIIEKKTGKTNFDKSVHDDLKRKISRAHIHSVCGASYIPDSIFESYLEKLKGHVRYILKEDKDFEISLSPFGEYIFSEILNRSLKNVFSLIQKSFTNLYSLSSSRGNADRIYSNKSEKSEINEILINFLKVNIRKHNTIDSFIDDSLKLFKLGDKLLIERQQGVASEVIIIKGNQKFKLADLGFGYSQLLPIILKIAIVAKENDLTEFNDYDERFGPSVLMLEEPESNLHPSYQSKLADMLMVAATKFNIQFIIETHSEYLVRKLQYLVANKDIKSECLKIYYFNEQDIIQKDKKIVKKIEILNDGSLSDDFGTGFFDEALNWKFELLKLKNKN